jgi:nanoRNase/pAp phosphatase (c-di-AMP/oligoRNAs hydrolase)
MKKTSFRSGSTTEERLEALKAIFADSKTPYILIYSDPDPDALASAMALKEIMGVFGLNPVIGYTGVIGRLENEAMINLLRIPAVPVTEKDLAKADLIALVDAQPAFFRNFSVRFDIVFDHHPRKAKAKVAVFEDIRTKCIATSSILTEYMLAAGVNISERLATALYYGIRTDSLNAPKGLTSTDEMAKNNLEKKVNRGIIRKIEFSSYSLSRLDYFNIALVRLRYANNVLYSHIGPVPYSDVCAQVADFLIRVKEANRALVSGVVGDKLVIVFRSDGLKESMGKIAEEAFSSIGSAGGHRTKARAEIQEDSMPEGILLTQNEEVESFVIKRLSDAEHSFRPLHKLLAKRGSNI